MEYRRCSDLLDGNRQKTGNDNELVCMHMNTLQRCVRLYLCATSGPGEMRSDGTNGWRSVRELVVNNHDDYNDDNGHNNNSDGNNNNNFATKNTSMNTVSFGNNNSIVEPPGSHTWHSVTYPGLKHRFKISTYIFFESVPVFAYR